MLGSLRTKTEAGKRKKDSATSDQSSDNESRRQKQLLLSLFEINVVRYSLFIENLRAEHVHPGFLVDFMTLPADYFSGNADRKYDQFLFRYGTHYVHSAEFGGQILFENSRVSEDESGVEDLAENSWKEIQTTFGSSKSTSVDGSVPVSFVSVDLGGSIQNVDTNSQLKGLRNEAYGKLDSKSQHNWTSVLVQSQGGRVSVAKLITRLEGNTGPTLGEWLRSIPKYPKAFRARMRPISDLLDFNIRLLFSPGQSNETCELSYRLGCPHGTDLDQFQAQFDRRRKSLEFATEIFRHRSANVFSDLEIEAGSSETCLFSVDSKASLFPTYAQILNGTDVKVVAKLDTDYPPFVRGEEIYVTYRDQLWFSKNRNENYDFLRTFKTPTTVSRLLNKNLESENF